MKNLGNSKSCPLVMVVAANGTTPSQQNHQLVYLQKYWLEAVTCNGVTQARYLFLPISSSTRGTFENYLSNFRVVITQIRFMDHLAYVCLEPLQTQAVKVPATNRALPKFQMGIAA